MNGDALGVRGRLMTDLSSTALGRESCAVASVPCEHSAGAPAKPLDRRADDYGVPPPSWRVRTTVRPIVARCSRSSSPEGTSANSICRPITGRIVPARVR
jgi:hypothetical protein